jgi:hypothetical protein
MANPTSSNWQMAFRGTISVAGPGGIAWFLLGEQEQSFSWPVIFVFAPQIGLNLQVVPYSPSPFASFTTSSALGPTDFTSFGSILQAGTSVGAGGILIDANFFSVDHSPNPIGMQGLDVGIGAGFGWCPGRFRVFDSVTVANAGSTKEIPFSALDDDSDLSDAVTDAVNDYLQNNTDPAWIR